MLRTTPATGSAVWLGFKFSCVCALSVSFYRNIFRSLTLLSLRFCDRCVCVSVREYVRSCVFMWLVGPSVSWVFIILNFPFSVGPVHFFLLSFHFAHFVHFSYLFRSSSFEFLSLHLLLSVIFCYVSLPATEKTVNSAGELKFNERRTMFSNFITVF